MKRTLQHGYKTKLYSKYQPNYQDITLLTSYFQDSSKESLAAVLIHEFVHAYIKQVGSGILNSPHNETAAKCINPMAAYLKQAYNLSSTDAYVLTWSGVSDSKAFQECYS
nr:hypothetical protein [Pedobacter sp. ASV19]